VRLDWLNAICRSSGPFATVMIDASHDTEDAEQRAQVRRRNVRDQLSRQGAPPSVLDAVETALDDSAPPAGEEGRALVVDEWKVLVDVRLDAPPSVDLVTWAAVPDLLPIVQAVAAPVPTVVVRVDEEGGELLGPDDPAPAVVAGRTKPVHKARGGGWSHRAMQARVEETWKHNAKEVAALVDERVRATDAQLLLIMGDDRSRARLRDALPERSARIAEEVPRSGGESPGEVAGAVARSVDLLLDGERRAAFARYTELAGRAEGLAVTALPAVVAAARAQAVETLFIDPARVVDATVWAGPEPAQLALTRDELGDLGVESFREVAAVAALVRAATCMDAALVVLDDPDVVLGRDRLDDGSDSPQSAVLGGDTLSDGVGAILRFPIGPV
jgi:hypothetical protein